MAEPPQPIVLSDEEEEDQNPISSTLPFQPLRSSKKRRTEIDPYPNLNPPATVLILDDDDPIPLPSKPPVFKSPRYFVLDDSPCTIVPSSSQIRVSDSPQKFSGLNELVCLESENESESCPGKGKRKDNESIASGFGVVKDWSSIFDEPTCSHGHDDLDNMSEESVPQPTTLQDDIGQVLDHPPDKANRGDQMGNILKQRRKTKVRADKSSTAEAVGRIKITKEERIRLMEEKNLKKEQEKLQKAALKAEAAQTKKIQKEKQKWEKGKSALKSIVAEVDTKILELASVGGNLLTRFAERGLTYRITSNPIERSIVWTMTVPEHISQTSPETIEIQYVLLVYEAEDFCNLVIKESLWNHVLSVRSRYPSYTVCYLTHKLMPYINKRGMLHNGYHDSDKLSVDDGPTPYTVVSLLALSLEQEVYKNPTNDNGWRRPPIEEVLAKLTTNFLKVHSRQCIDEAELAEHIVGLTCSLSSCQFRKKLTRLDVNANGYLKDCVDRNIINKSPWLKALVAIPKVQARFAIAIWKKYPTMKSLLRVYMDPNISVHQKEFLLEDLVTEGLLGDDRRVGEVCSKRVYRILMAQSGSMRTDDVEDGADLFGHQST